LERVPVDERGLQGMELVSLGQAFDGDHRVAGVSDGQSQAGVDPAAVDEDGARAALTVIAALLGAGQSETFAEQVEKRGARVDEDVVVVAVDPQGELDVRGRPQKWERQSTQSSQVRGQFGDQSEPM
jgi:hypothetical protein